MIFNAIEQITEYFISIETGNCANNLICELKMLQFIFFCFLIHIEEVNCLFYIFFFIRPVFILAINYFISYSACGRSNCS